MPNKIHSSDRLTGVTLNGGTDTTYSYDQIKASLLFNIRDQMEYANNLALQQIRILERIDRRLAKRVKLR